MVFQFGNNWMKQISSDSQILAVKGISFIHINISKLDSM